MTTPDALTLLRHALTANKAPTLHAAPDPSSAALPTDSLASATHLYFPAPAITLSLDTPTRFQRKTPEPLTFTLREIFFAWLLQGESTAEYIARCQALGIHNLTFLEKADLSTWLEGGDSSDYIVEDKSIKASEDVTRQTSAPSRVVAVKGRGAAVLRIHTKERTITSRITILRGHKPTDFTSVALTAKQFFSSRLKTTPQTVQVAAPSARSKDPIILLSPSASSLVTMHNVKALLEEGRFVEPGEAAREAGGGRGPELLHISHKSARLGGRAVRYVVVEGVEKFRPDYWDRVVCVFTTGQVWQFREYLYPEPRKLFQHVYGVFVAYSSDPVNPVQKEWNITTVKVERHRRHTDREVVRGFWDGLEKWMEARGKLRR